MDVVIESQEFVAVFLQETESVVVAKVFKLDERVLSITVHNGRHEFINQIIIGLSSNSLVSQPDVERIVQQFLNNGHH